MQRVFDGVKKTFLSVRMGYRGRREHNGLITVSVACDGRSRYRARVWRYPVNEAASAVKLGGNTEKIFVPYEYFLRVFIYMSATDMRLKFKK